MAALLAAAVSFLPAISKASIAYGSINNFDTVNDTGHVCHGFEIEIEDCHSTDISYTYDYNHYGTSVIRQDDSIPGHPKTIIRWASKKNPDGTWASHTAIPSGPIQPTDGHQFTNPAVNFGGEHFGVGYGVPVGAIRYHWLIDDGAGQLVSGGVVQVSTPVYTYYPAVAGGPAQVQAVIAPPAPEAPEAKEFGIPVWVKEIRTTSHNSGEVKLRDLVSDDPADANEKNWKNGEPDEVEVEWQILQKDYGKADGGPNNEVPAAAEDLPGGDEVVTRRYEFYKYTGPLDTETGEAMGDVVGVDGLHGDGVKIVNGIETDLSSVEVVGEFVGSQMAAVDVAAPVGLVDHVSEGRIHTPYAARRLVVEGVFGFVCMMEGALPSGMDFDVDTGILSGTPLESGTFSFSITATDGVDPGVAKNYTLLIADVGEELPPTRLVDTVVSPIDAGTTTGDGAYAPGAPVTVTASALPGFRFVNWTDNGKVVSTSESHVFTIDVNHSLIANFTVDLPRFAIDLTAAPAAAGITTGGGLADEGSSVTVTATAQPGYSFVNWTESGSPVSSAASFTFTATAARNLVANFITVPIYQVNTSSSPAEAGDTSGGGSHTSGTSATVSATAHAGQVFWKWTSGSNTVSTSASYTFTVSSNRNLVANFVAAGISRSIAIAASPLAGGTVTGGGAFLTGDQAVLSATPRPGYVFDSWREGNTLVSNSPVLRFTVVANRTLTARFNEAFEIHTVSSPAAGGATEMDSATYKTGENARATAIPADGFVFSNWTENGNIVSSDVDYTFDVAGNRSLVANFIADSGVTVNASCEPSEAGEVDGDDAYPSGDDVIVSAWAKPGFAFVNWTAGGVVVSTDASFAFTADANVALVAHFVPPVAITASAQPPEGGVVDGAGDHAAGTDVSLTAVANPGYAFNGWTENSAPLPGHAALSFPAAGPRALVATFIALPPVSFTDAAPGSPDMRISWPSSHLGWTLEESADLATWTSSVRVVNSAGGTSSVTVPKSEAHRYFRLSHP